jgi:hypothetical protein
VSESKLYISWVKYGHLKRPHSRRLRCWLGVKVAPRQSQTMSLISDMFKPLLAGSWFLKEPLGLGQEAYCYFFGRIGRKTLILGLRNTLKS